MKLIFNMVSPSFPIGIWGTWRREFIPGCVRWLEPRVISMHPISISCWCCNRGCSSWVNRMCHTRRAACSTSRHGRTGWKVKKQCPQTSDSADIIPREKLYCYVTIDCIEGNGMRGDPSLNSLPLYHKKNKSVTWILLATNLLYEVKDHENYRIIGSKEYFINRSAFIKKWSPGSNLSFRKLQ